MATGGAEVTVFGRCRPVTLAGQGVGVVCAHFGSVLDNQRIPADRRLFLTATPKNYRRQRGQKPAALGTIARDMSDRVVYGEVAHRVGLAQAIDNKWLSDYQVLVLVANDKDASAIFDRSTQIIGSRGQPIRHRALAIAMATFKAIQQAGVKRIISFHASNLKAREFQDALVELQKHSRVPIAGNLIVRNVHGGMSAARREEVLSGFEVLNDGDCMVVTNARCLGEGIDVPAVDAVIFADPKNSYVDIVQAVGRAIRPSADKSAATIVVPVLLPHEANNADALTAVTGTPFRFVWQVLSAIRAHDSRLGDEIDGYAREYARTGVMGSLPARISLINACSIPLDSTLLLKAFNTQIYRAVALADMYGLGKAEKYAAAHGSLRSITKHTIVDDFELGWWIVKQRVRLRKKIIDPAIKNRLHTLGIVWDAHDNKWQEMYNRLTSWILEQSGRTAADIPTRLVIDGFNVTAWLRVQRGLYRDQVLSAERIKLLEAVGIEWNPHEARWQEAMAACRKWNASGRDLSSVANDSLVDEYPLGVFISHQRQFYKKGLITPERIAELESLGMVWDKKDAIWMANYRACEHYVTNEGELGQIYANGPAYRGLAISRWLHHQRQRHKKGRLEPSRKALLDALGINWTPKRGKVKKKLKERYAAAWDAMLALCVEYVASHGGVKIRADTKFKGRRIGDWLRNNLYALRRGALAPERANKLSQVVKSFGYELQHGRSQPGSKAE